MPARIEIKALHKFTGAVNIVDFSISVLAGQIVGLVGGQGAGQQTVLHILAGKELPDEGSVHLNGFDTVRAREQAFRQVTAVFPPPPLLPACLHELLNESRPILLLAEPMAGMVGRAAHIIENGLKQMAHAQNKTIVLTSLYPQQAQRVCDRLLVMENGRLVADTPVDHDLSLVGPADYLIRVRGGLDVRWGSWLGGLAVTAMGSETILSGKIIDQSALHGLLARIRDLGLPLVEVNHIQSDLEMSLGKIGTDINK